VTVERIELAPGYAISRVLRGGWQLAGGHGEVDPDRAVADMAAFVAAGITTFDCADIYTGVEEMIGTFRERLAVEGRAVALQVHTKFVPDWDSLATLTADDVRRIVERSLARLRTDRLDLVQFHWWNYDVPGMERAALALRDLQAEGKLRLVGGTNFDAPHARRLLDAGVPLATMQTQYSLLDRRPERALAPLCAETGMRLLCYGTVAGGFLSDRWLGRVEPAPESLTNRSLVKYKLIVEDFGGWDLFQALLSALSRIATRHATSLTAVATRWVLDRPHVAGAIVGARYADHLPDTLSVFRLSLDAADHAALDDVLRHATGPEGDTYTLERDRTGRHGRIMKYDLNRE
jgi:aryl-alcohol dehydrogenase-like predicted oxidoreductase